MGFQTFPKLTSSHIIREQIENLDQPGEDTYAGDGEVYKMDQDEG